MYQSTRGWITSLQQPNEPTRTQSATYIKYPVQRQLQMYQVIQYKRSSAYICHSHFYLVYTDLKVLINISNTIRSILDSLLI
jgi:hypothetical protein